jgi:drug/metabolite transporter (DMT)-like permease
MPMLKLLPSEKQLAGVLGGLVFMGMLMWEGFTRDVKILDLSLALTVPLCYALGNTYLKRRFVRTSPLALSCGSLAVAGIVLGPLAWIVPLESASDPNRMTVAVASLMVSSFLATGLAIYVFYKLIHDHGPLFAGMTAYLIPVVALLWGWVDHEPVTLLQVLALAGILAMVSLVQKGAASVRTPI